MTAKGISDGLQEQFGEIIPWNFQCTVFNSPDEFALVGDDMGWGRFEKYIPLRFRKAGRVWRGGAREAH